MQRLRNLLLMTTALLPFSGAPAYAGPNGGTVVGGSANIQNPGTANVTVNQFSDKAIINWNLFNIGVGEKTTFVQPSSSSVALNRVTGGQGPSQILGSLDANGKVFIVNRDGIIFGAGAVITTAGFLATTSDIKNDDFMAGRYNFQVPGRPDASIVNMGTITATSGGFAALVAPGVRNSGTITATLGTVGLAAGNTFSLDFYGDKLVTLGVGDQIANQVKDVATGQTLKSLVTNEGKLKANGGRVELTAAAARQVVDAVINTSGVIEANSVGVKNGQIVLGAATAASKPAAAPVQKVRVSGTLSASGKDKGTKGGSIVVTGETIEVAGATIDASGRDGGGKVLIGGDWGGGKPDKSLVSNQSAQLENFSVPTATTVSVDAATRIDASAKDRGHGGKVVLWADDRLSFAGTILALGGTEFGNGGFAEVSGKGILNYTGTADLRAPNGSVGTLLLDPTDYYIVSTAGSAPTGASEITNTALQAQLSSSNVVITTSTAPQPGQNGDIFVNAPVVWNASTTLTLNAIRNVNIAFVGVNGHAIENTGGGSLIVRADNAGTGIGTISLAAGTFPERVVWSNSTGTVSFYYNPTNYTSPTNFTALNGRVVTNGSVPNQFTAYMLVNTASNLNTTSANNIGQNLSGKYALGKDIDAGGATLAPIASISFPFLGVLDGAKLDGTRYTLSNFQIAPTTASVNNIGLFGAIGAGSVVRNLNITNATVTANPNVPSPGQFIGILAGTNGGTISNVSVAGVVTNGSVASGVIAGGLVGQNGIFGPGASMGTITSSHSAANVTVGDATSGGSSNNAGGLVGSNPGTITSSSASGSISGGANSFIGGLVARNDSGASIASSSATGNVTTTAANAFGTATGGLAGFNSATSTITGSNASGNVSTNAGGMAGGLVGQNEGTIPGSTRTGGTISGSGAGVQYVSLGGLAGVNNASGVIQNSSVTNATINGTLATAGGLVGLNSGIVTGTAPGQVFVSGVTLTLDGFSSIGGGLVGINNAFGSPGSIHNASASGTISRSNTALANTFMTFGGLVGRNSGGIANSTASTTVNGGAGSAGGLVGQNEGSIATSSASGNVSGTGVLATSAYIGGLVGSNNSTGQITGSTASGAVLTGGFAHAGGLIGDNSASLSNLSASNPVTATGNGAVIGGLIGANNAGATITSSRATGTVTSSFNAVGALDLTVAGGLVGTNMGTITAAAVPNAGTACSAGASCATGAVSVGSHGAGGGLVGLNLGAITNSFAAGAVTGAAGLAMNMPTNIGGLVGFNSAGGTITGSHARGNVGGNVAFLMAGGLAGDNTGAISNSFASGNVTVGNDSQAGGLVGASGGDCPGCSGNITNASASGNVTGGTASVTGGLAGGSSSGSFTNTSASGAVTAGADSVIGGLVGALGFGTVLTNSHSSGTVTGAGANVTAGGLVGASFGTINGNSTASGPVSVTSESFAGGLVGGNLGRVESSTSSATVTGGSNSVLGGLAGLNAGTITQSSASGAVTTGDFGAAGGLVGANVVFEGVPPGMAIAGSSFPNGTIVNSSSTGAVTGGFGSGVGGLIGLNGGSISGLTSNAIVSGGDFSTVGGLVGMNGGPTGGPSFPAALTGCSSCGLAGVSVSSGPGSIANSSASGNVTGGQVGGLVGSNPGTISGSTASGSVTSTSQFGSPAGGLVGHNSGVISGSSSTSVVAGPSDGTSFLIFGSLGGLVGANDLNGIISNSSASGSVTGGGDIGGLVGSNVGSISNSSASGAVSGSVFATGGLVGSNAGTITGSSASGGVTGGVGSLAGGLVGLNFGSIANSSASGNVTGGEGSTLGGLVGMNLGEVTNSFSTGTVTADPSTAGGLVGFNFGTITGSWSSGAVSGDGGSFVGGLVGFNFLGTIQNSYSVSKVTVGDGGTAGGLAAVNFGAINQSFATGAVTGGASSYVGGLVAYNFGDGGVSGFPVGTIAQSYATGAVTGGANSVVGGLVAENAGSIDQAYAAGRVIGGPGSITGGLVASNNFSVPGALPGDPNLPPSGTPGTATNSYWDTQTTGQTQSAGGTPLTTAQLTTSLPSGFSPQAWNGGNGTNYPSLIGQPNPLPVPGPPAPVDSPPPPPPPPPPPDNPTNVQQLSPLVNITATLVNDTFTEKKQDEVVNTNTPSGSGGGSSGGGSSSGSPSGQKGGGNQGGNNARPPAFGPAPFGLGLLPSGMPPLHETRFLSNEVVYQLGGRMTADEIAATARQLGLQITYQETIGLLGRTVIRFRLPDGANVRGIIAELQAKGAEFSAQPSYTYDLIQDVAQTGAAPADTSRKGDSAQYIVEKLNLVQAHLIATGSNVKVAVIDSEIDAKHPDLEGAIAGSYDALPSDDQTAHPHGTGMAGAIASHKRLLGVAPGAQLLAIRAFGVNSGAAQGTSLNIVKGLQWAVDQGAKVINMSFAGPRDPILQQAIKRLTEQGIILIAAAGNAGPKSAPLFPGADPNVIAVSATDVDDKTYKNANRGKYVAIAAPGVDILVPAPEGGYQLTTGTSVAAAHISGVVALMLERNKELRPAEVRSILSATAKNIGGAKTDVGAGLVDPLQALSKAGPKSAQVR